MNNQQNTSSPQEQQNVSKTDKKGIVLIVLLSIVAIFLLFKIFSPSNSADVPAQQPVSSTTVFSTESTTATATATTTTVASTTLPSTTESTTVATTTQPTTVAIDETQEILDAITKGLSQLKSDNASFIGEKTQVISIELLDCSVPAMVGTINWIIDFFEGEETYTYDFTNGKCIDPEKNVEATSFSIIPPPNAAFALTKEGVASAKKEQQGEYTVYSVTVVPESSTLENSKPPHHSVACDVLDFSLFELPMGEIKKADIQYVGAVITIKVDKNGNVVEYSENMGITAFGEAGVGAISGSGNMEGSIKESWKISWK